MVGKNQDQQVSETFRIPAPKKIGGKQTSVKFVLNKPPSAVPNPERGVGCFSNIAVPYDCDADATDKEGEWSAKKQVPDGWMVEIQLKVGVKMKITN